MSDERAESVEETRIEDLPVEPIFEEEQAKVKGGGSSIAYVQAVVTTSAAAKTD